MTSSVDFESQRHRLTLLAYRMCGSWTDAEDTVQTVAIEWLRAADDVANPAGWLTQVTVLRSIDALRARQREAAYVGPWLPEPLVTAIDTDPLGELERSEALSTAFLVLAESLTPPQRAVVVLRALGYEYAEIAEILGITAATCRQHHVRGLRRLDRVNRRDVEHDPGISNISGTACLLRQPSFWQPSSRRREMVSWRLSLSCCTGMWRRTRIVAAILARLAEYCSALPR